MQGQNEVPWALDEARTRRSRGYLLTRPPDQEPSADRAREHECQARRAGGGGGEGAHGRGGTEAPLGGWARKGDQRREGERGHIPWRGARSVDAGDWLRTLDPERSSELREAFELVPDLEAQPLDELCRWLP